MSYLEVLSTFDEQTLPEIDIVTLGALERFSVERPERFSTESFEKPLVLGSVNAYHTARILFRDVPGACFGDESNYQSLIENEAIDSVVILSASGGKHAVLMAKCAKERGLPLWLLTNNPDAPAKEYVSEEQVVLFPRNREPYTYNASTYMSMLFASGEEQPSEVLSFIEEKVAPVVPEGLEAYDAFFIIIPPEMLPLREMLLTKFDELLEPHVSGRVFTLEEAKHAKTVNKSESEYFLSFGAENTLFGAEGRRATIPLPEQYGAAGAMAIAYYVIGRLQQQHPPYFKNSIEEYTKEASTIFGSTIPVIVE